MNNLAVHMRIIGPQVSNEDVDTRRSAISDLSLEWRKGRTIDQSLATATGIGQALHGVAPSVVLGAEIQTAVQKYASAFLCEDSPFEVGIVAGMAFIDIAKAKPAPTNEWTTPEVLAAALWSALSYQRPLAELKREALRLEVIEAAEGYVVSAAEASRARSPVGDFEELAITLAAPAKGGEADAGALPAAASNFAKSLTQKSTNARVA